MLDGRTESALPVTLRIPGPWREPLEFSRRLPRGCRCTPDGLVLADGSTFELSVLPADEEFPEVFATSCPKLPTEQERAGIDNYAANVCVSGPGGSLTAATKLMEAGAAIIAAGGCGVFVDNSCVAHGGADWLTLAGDVDHGGAYWAFVSTVRAERELYSIGMHILGCRDAIVPLTGNDEFDFRTLHSFLGFSAFSGTELRDGALIGDPVLPSFRLHAQADDRSAVDTPMHNPRGRWRLETLDVSRN